VLHFSGHGEHDGAESITGGANGMRSLFGVLGLAVFAAPPAVAGVEIELGYDGNDGGQVGLELHNLAAVVEGLVTAGGIGQTHVDHAVDLARSGRGPEIGLVPLAPSGLLGLVGVSFVAPERMSLASTVALALLSFLT
jgi:hypothetical protein